MSYILLESNLNDGDFYVYKLIDPNNMIPFYIGKGKDFRYKHHFNFNSNKNKNNHKINKIKKIISTGGEVIIEIIFRSDDEKRVIEKEKEMILKYGRRDNGTGILTNLTDGGEGLSGYKPSDDLKNIWSLNRKGSKNGMYNKKHTDLSINKMIETKIARYKSGEIKPTKHSEEWKQTLRDNNPNSKEVDTNIIFNLNEIGYSIPEISKKTGISIGIIRRRLKSNNIEVKYQKTKKIDIEDIIEKLKNGFSKKLICEEYKISLSTLNVKIRQYNKK